MSSEEANSIRSSYIRKKVDSSNPEKYTFYSHQGLPSVFCSRSISIGHLLLAHQGMGQSKSADDIDDMEIKNIDNDMEILHKAASIIRRDINQIPSTCEYPNPSEISLTASKAFIPESLLQLLVWIAHDKSFVNATNTIDNDSSTLRRLISIAECIIYTSRRYKNQVIPPLHFGLMLHLQHEHGSRKLIDLLNACGFCSSYPDLRAFLTAVAKDELEKNEDVYIPAGLIHRRDNGCLLQEGDDNIDINTETIDGKNTYHSLARVVFQQQPVQHGLEQNRIKRQDNKTLDVEKSTQKQFALLPYMKPSRKAEPPRVDNLVNLILGSGESLHRNPQAKELLWVALRAKARGSILGDTESPQTIPMWTGFNSRFVAGRNSVTVASYAPAIDATPSDVATVYTCLVKGRELARDCGQNFHIHTFDQQIYAVAQLVKLSKPQEFPNLVVRLGGFHASACFISCIGKLWGSGGLRDLLVDSGVYAGNTADQMLTGRQFHRAVRGLTLCFEALMQVLLESFLAWLENQENESVCSVNEALTKLKTFATLLSENKHSWETYNDTINTVLTTLHPVLIQFLDHGCNSSETFKYWAGFIEAVNVLLNFIRAEREGDWEMHLQSQSAMLPFYFACDKPNYSRWASLYVTEMRKTLPAEVDSAFRRGEFAVRFSPGPFKGLWSDMAVEMSVIKDHKSDSGIVGFTRKESAVLRWTLTRHILASYNRCMQIRCGLEDDPSEVDPGESKHEQESESFLKRDETHARNMISFIRENMSNPFDVSVSKLVNIASGLTASAEVATSLSNALERGCEKLEAFVSNCLEPSETPRSFHDPITRLNIKTFTNMKVRTVLKSGGKLVKKAVSPETVYQRALTVAEVRPQLTLASILCFPLCAVPPSLFREDGTRRKTDKSDLLHVLELEVKESVLHTNRPNFTSKTIHIVDAMADIHSLPWKNLKTFAEMGHLILQKILTRLTMCDEVHYVFDRYDSELHPKNDERVLRHGDSNQVFEIISGRPLPEMKKLLSNNNNKANLTSFISHFIESNATYLMKKTPGKSIFIGGGYESSLLTKKVTSEEVLEVPHLSSNHSEADTRMVFHAFAQCQIRGANISNIIIESPDTDVFLLFLGHFHEFPVESKVWFLTGRIMATTDQRRCIPIHLVHSKLGWKVAKALLPVHALTGCDTVSSLYGIGKKKAFAALLKLNDKQLRLLHLLPEVAQNEQVLTNAERYVATLYDTASKYLQHHHSLNALRVAYAQDMKRNSTAGKMPPSQPELLQHAKRSAWQTAEWLSATKQTIAPLSLSDYGWEVQNETLLPFFFEGKTCIELLDGFFCFCGGKNPCSKRCQCKKNNLECCELCNCSGSCQIVGDDDDPDDPEAL